MKHAADILIWLYPKAWRDRYEREFRALLDDVPPTWRTFLNVFGGAMNMQFKTGKSWKIVAACAVAGVIAAAALTWTIPHRYVSTAVLKMGDIDDLQMNAEAQKILARAPLTRLIVDADLYQDLRGTTPIEDIVLQLKTQDIMIKRASEKPFFTVSVTAPDAGRAQKATQILAADFLNAKVGTLVDPASLPVISNGPRLSRNVFMGLLAGMAAGSFLALFSGLKLWKVAAGLGLAGAISGAAIGYVLPDRFSSQALLRWQSEDQAAAGKSVRQLVVAVAADKSLQAVVKTFKLYPGESGQVKTLREHLHFDPVANGSAMTIRFEDKDRFVAQKVVADVVSRLIDEAVMRRKSPGDVRMTLELLDPASLPWHPYFPNRPAAAGTGLLTGLLAAVMFGIWRYSRTPLPKVAC